MPVKQIALQHLLRQQHHAGKAFLMTVWLIARHIFLPTVTGISERLEVPR